MKKILIFILFVITTLSLVSCKQENNDLGTFYSVKEAYNQKLLSKEDLESIAYYHNYHFAISSIPNPLDIEIEKKIKQTKLLEIKSWKNSQGDLRYPKATIDDISIISYYGEYNNCHAVMLTDVYTEYTQATWIDVIDGVEIHYGNGNSILIWVPKPTDKEMKEVIKHFDLIDPKVIWEQSEEEDFTDDLVIVVLRKSSTAPKLEIRHFGLDNIESIRYINWESSESDEEPIDAFRAIIFITLKETGKDKVIEAIRHLEKLEFVKAAEPNSYGTFL